MDDQKRKQTKIKIINTKGDDPASSDGYSNRRVISTVKIKDNSNDIDIAGILYGLDGLTVYHTMFGNVVICCVEGNKIYFYHNGEKYFVRNNGKLYDDGECMIFPSKTERDWTKFKSNVLNVFTPGEYIIIGNNKCILDSVPVYDDSTHKLKFNTAVAIAGDDDMYPGKIEFDHTFYTTINKVRSATEAEINDINDILSRKQLAWNKSTLSVEVKKWYPKQDETYYSLLIKGACRFFVTSSQWDGNAVDIDRYESNNCFQTKEDADQWCAKFNNASEEISKQLVNRD